MGTFRKETIPCIRITMIRVIAKLLLPCTGQNWDKSRTLTPMMKLKESIEGKAIPKWRNMLDRWEIEWISGEWPRITRLAQHAALCPKVSAHETSEKAHRGLGAYRDIITRWAGLQSARISTMSIRWALMCMNTCRPQLRFTSIIQLSCQWSIVRETGDQSLMHTIHKALK